MGPVNKGRETPLTGGKTDFPGLVQASHWAGEQATEQEVGGEMKTAFEGTRIVESLSQWTDTKEDSQMY